MKNKAKVLSTALFLSVFIMIVSYGQQKDEWKGKIEIEDGVKVIKNPREPIYGEITFELEEDLSLGYADDENYMFYKVRGVAVDNQGNIYISDMRNYRIQKFDKNGRYVQTIGRKGQGPGEFEQPTKVLINEITGNIFVLDQRRIKIFDKKGNYINSVLPKKFPIDFTIDAEDNIYGKLSSMSEEGDFREFCKVSSKGDILKSYARYPFYFILQSRSKSGMVIVFSGLEPDLHISNIDYLSLIYGFSLKYELNVSDTDGNLLFRITKDEPEHEFTVKERQRYKEMRIFYKLPQYKPFYYSIFTDNRSRIYVQTHRSGNRGIIEKEIDIFSKDGHYLYKTKLPLNTYVIKNGFLYTYVIDEDEGMEYVKRYKIKNWEQIKTGI